MTCNVSSGTLNTTQLNSVLLVGHQSCKLVIQVSTDIQEWRKFHVVRMWTAFVTGHSPSLVHASLTTYLIPSEIRLCHS